MQTRGKGKGKGRGKNRRVQYRRKRGRKTSTENEQLLQKLQPSEQDIMKLLAAQSHIGRNKCHVNMKRYIWKRRQDGIHVINLQKTWAKLILAARILVTVREPSDICIMSTRTYGQRGAIKFAHYTGATALVGKWVPGTFTNPQNKAFFEPRIVIVDDPSTCFAALRETSYVGIPVIALCGSDNNTRFVDCGIPCNNRGKFSIGLMFWLLARELLRMRGDPSCIRTVEWKESVDLFFYRDADEIKRQQDAKLAKQQKAKMVQNEMAQQQQHGMDDEYQAMQPMEEQQGMDENVLSEQVQQAQPQYQPQGDQNWDMPATAVEDWDQAQNVMVDDQQYVNVGQPQYDEQQINNQTMGMQNW